MNKMIMYLFLFLISYKLLNFQWFAIIYHFFDSETVSQPALQRLGILPSSQIPAGILTGSLILLQQGALMQIKRMLNLNPCNYSAVVLQICCLCSAAQQHFQILPKEENTVFLMKRMILAPVFVVFLKSITSQVHYGGGCYKILKRHHLNAKQNQYLSNKEQRSLLQHMSTFYVWT